MNSNDPTSELPVILFEEKAAWAAWLDAHHASAAGVWLRLAKKAVPLQPISYAEAREVALCYGWIASQKRRYDEQSWVQKFIPHGRKSLWSRVNREKAEVLIASGQMQPAGLRAVEAARQDGHGDAAYDSPARAQVPADLQAALASNAAARTFFATLDRQNRYAILHRLQMARKPETRARRIAQFIAMLERQETLYP